jgi:hypothetical protein
MPQCMTAPSLELKTKDRFLTDESEVWSQNAWDHVLPPDNHLETFMASLEKQRSAPVPEDDKHKYNEKPSRHWFACDIYLSSFR